jgi:hypothetical protein
MNMVNDLWNEQCHEHCEKYKQLAVNLDCATSRAVLAEGLLVDLEKKLQESELTAVRRFINWWIENDIALSFAAEATYCAYQAKLERGNP